jgi:hypothetical protein
VIDASQLRLLPSEFEDDIPGTSFVAGDSRQRGLIDIRRHSNVNEAYVS